MMLWTKGLSLMLVEGTEPAQRQGPMYVRMLLFWAVSLTMGGSLASLSIIRQRAGCIDELRAGSSSLALITPTPLPPRELLWQRINSTAVRAHALALLEQTVGWAVCCASTNLAQIPTPTPRPNPSPSPGPSPSPNPNPSPSPNSTLHPRPNPRPSP